MAYLVMEIQKNGDTVSNIVTPKDSYQLAKAHYYQILSAAAVSTVETHTAVILSDTGEFIVKETFYHPAVQEATQE